MNNKPLAEREEELTAGITGPACPFCSARQTQGISNGWPNAPESSGYWSCANCDESGNFDIDGLHWAPEGEANA